MATLLFVLFVLLVVLAGILSAIDGWRRGRR